MSYAPAPTDVFTTGSITAADAVVAAPAGNGVPLSGASTAGSIVALASGIGSSAWVIQISGTISGTYYFEISIDSTNGTDGAWINVNGRQTGLSPSYTVAGYSTTIVGEYRGSMAGAKYLRVRNVGGSGLSTTVKMATGPGSGPVFLYSSIPNGTNTIGNVKIPADQTPLPLDISYANQLDEIRTALMVLASVKGILADLRVSVVNTPATTITSGTVTTVTTVGTVTNMAQIGGVPMNGLLESIENQTYNSSFSQNITRP